MGFSLHEYQRSIIAGSARCNPGVAALRMHMALLRENTLTRAADGLRLREIPRAVPLTHPMFRAHALHINRDRYK